MEIDPSLLPQYYPPSHTTALVSPKSKLRTNQQLLKSSKTPVPPESGRVEPDKWNLVEPTLTQIQRHQLTQILDKNQDVFSQHETDLGLFPGFKHVIDTGDHPPLRCKPRPLSQAKRESLQSEIRKLQEAKIIRCSRSNWASPIVMVIKKDLTWRLCIDYRQLNLIATCCQYPLPKVDTILRDMQGACYFTALDLMKGFHQIGMHENSIPKTAFVTPIGQFEYLRLPFGLNSAPAAFQAAMSTVLAGMEERVMVYIDDVIIYTTTFEKHLETITEVCQRLREANLKVKKDKCEFCRTELLYLGHIVNAHGIKTDPAKTEAVSLMPYPTCTLALETFLGKTAYYHKFIENYSNIAYPLTRLKTKQAIFKFGPPEKAAFDALVKALCNAPVLRHPNFTHTFILATDASGYALGAVLSQTCEDGEHPIAYASRTLKDAELRYSATEREGLAIVWAVHHFIEYLEGRPFTVVTDHQALVALSHKAMTTNRLEMIAHKLTEFQITYVYRPGSENANADTLSRYPYVPCKGKRSKVTQTNESESNSFDPNADLAITHQKTIRIMPLHTQTRSAGRQSANARKQVELPPTQALADTTTEPHLIDPILEEPHRDRTKFLLENIGNYQSRVPDFRALIYYHTHGEWDPADLPRTDLLKTAETFCLNDTNVLCKITGGGQKLITCIPPQLYQAVLYDSHTAPATGHFGLTKTLLKVLENYWWPNLNAAVRRYVQNCPLCLSHKVPPRIPREQLGRRPPPTRPWERIHMDVYSVGGETHSGNKYILAFVDSFSKYLVAVATPNHTAFTVVEAFMTRIALTYGLPDELASDNAPEFTGQLQEEFFRSFGVTRKFTTAYRPQANGVVERIFRSLRPILATLCHRRPRKWDQYLKYAIFAYNTSVHGSIQNTPFYLMFGRDPIFSYTADPTSPYGTTNQERVDCMLKAQSIVAERLISEQERSKDYYDQHLLPQEFFVGGCVLLRVNQVPRKQVYKIYPKFVGPYRVMQILGSTLFVANLQNPNPRQKMKQIHKDHAKPCALNYPLMHSLEVLELPFKNPAALDPNLDEENDDDE